MSARFTPADNLIGPRGGAGPIINHRAVVSALIAFSFDRLSKAVGSLLNRAAARTACCAWSKCLLICCVFARRLPDASPHYRRNAFLLG